jgi:hypothetical protein
MIFCRFRAAAGRRACVAKPSFTSPGHPGKHGLRLPDRPRPGEARLNSRFANVKSLKQGRRLTPRPGLPSACLTGNGVRWCGGSALIRMENQSS